MIVNAKFINSYKDNEVDLRVWGKKTIGICAFSFVPVGHATSSEKRLSDSVNSYILYFFRTRKKPIYRNSMEKKYIGRDAFYFIRVAGLARTNLFKLIDVIICIFCALEFAYSRSLITDPYLPYFT